MSLKLISHVNGDNDLIEAWLKYYLQLGVERFHLVVHGGPEENSRLLAIKDSYPIAIEDTYGGSFHIDEKKRRLDAALARHTGQWVLLVDSDEFVEFPYRDIPETVRQLEFARANLMAAPMVQRLTADGSLETPPVLDDPFQFFPLCSVDLYRRMGSREIFLNFPSFSAQMARVCQRAAITIPLSVPSPVPQTCAASRTISSFVVPSHNVSRTESIVRPSLAPSVLPVSRVSCGPFQPLASRQFFQILARGTLPKTTAADINSIRARTPGFTHTGTCCGYSKDAGCGRSPSYGERVGKGTTRRTRRHWKEDSLCSAENRRIRWSRKAPV